MTRIHELKTQIKTLTDEITEIQNQCNHPPIAVTYTNHANTGNWDRQDDCYWAALRCGLCEKRWTDDQNKVPKGAKKVKDL